MNTLIRNSSFINGEWKNANTGLTFPVYNPATGEEICRVADLSPEEVNEVVDAASDAWPEWRSRTAKNRAALLRNWHDLIQTNKEELAHLMTIECGKPLTESLGELAYGATYIK